MRAHISYALFSFTGSIHVDFHPLTFPIIIYLFTLLHGSFDHLPFEFRIFDLFDNLSYNWHGYPIVFCFNKTIWHYNCLFTGP